MGFPWSEGSLVASEPQSSRPGFPCPGLWAAGREVVGKEERVLWGENSAVLETEKWVVGCEWC